MKELSSQVIFTAHDHRARRVSFDVTSEQLSEVRPFAKSPKYPTFYQLRLDMDEVHELQVPTCSYRMGTPEMGYGFALIGKRWIKYEEKLYYYSSCNFFLLQTLNKK